MIRTIILATYLGIGTLGAMITLFLFGLFNPYNKACKLIFRMWSHPILFLGGIKIDIHGHENYDKDKGYVVCCNHLHIFDIPVLCIASQLNIKFAAKKELFNIPIFGQALRFAGMIKIDRTNTKDALLALKKVENAIEAKKVSITIFPEGTRNKLGKEMLPFKKGAFMIAMNTKQALLPVSINGTNKILQGVRTVPQTVSIFFHKPIEGADYTLKTRSEFMKKTREVIESKLEQ